MTEPTVVPTIPEIFQPGLFAGKSVFVTGGTSGINLAIAERFLEHGAHVTVLGRNVEKANAAAAGLVALGASAGSRGKVLAVTADVRDYAALSAVIAQSVAAHGPIDVLVCGAAGNFPAAAAQLSANGFKAVVDIDLLGSFNACRAAFEHLSRPASVVAISATQAFVPALMQSHVCAAKAGVEMLTKVLAMEWGGQNIRVNAIAPGPIADTEGMDRLAPPGDFREKLNRSIPLGRIGLKREVADLALFLASPAAAYITGTTLVVDGGQSLAGYGMNPMGSFG
jgi:NAD(P)-dependent dehydrogenase (short-subunit alcohol dehydrogenase family)